MIKDIALKCEYQNETLLCALKTNAILSQSTTTENPKLIAAGIMSLISKAFENRKIAFESLIFWGENDFSSCEIA